MTRINNTGNTGAQPIVSQDAGIQGVSKREAQKTQQEPSTAEQQQGKQAAQGRKNEMDLQGNLKQSELSQYHGPGGGPGGVQGTHGQQKTIPDAISGAGEILPKPRIEHRKSELQLQQELQGLQTELNEMFIKYQKEKDYPGLKEGLEVLEAKDSQKRAEERAAKEVLDTLVPKKESNSSKKTE